MPRSLESSLQLQLFRLNFCIHFSHLPCVMVKIFSSAHCSQTPSSYVFPLVWETKFNTHPNNKQHTACITTAWGLYVGDGKTKDSALNGNKHSQNFICSLILSGMYLQPTTAVPNYQTFPTIFNNLLSTFAYQVGLCSMDLVLCLLVRYIVVVSGPSLDPESGGRMSWNSQSGPPGTGSCHVETLACL